MNKETDKNRNRLPAKPPDGGKRPYQKPAFRYERVFETMALACGKINASQAQCKALLKSS